MQLSEKNLQRFLEYHKIRGKIISFDKPVMSSEKAREMVNEFLKALKNLSKPVLFANVKEELSKVKP